MKQYLCPSCSSSTALPLKECPACGIALSPGQWKHEDVDRPKPQHPCGLTLTGDLEKAVIIRPFMQGREVGRPMLQQATSEARFAATVQFLFSWRGESCFVAPAAGTPNSVILNNFPLDRETELQHGDVLMLRSRKSDRTAMPLVAEYFS